jgi:hypothetical protein
MPSLVLPMPALPTHTATRYVVPLREGGSLPAVLDTDEAGLFVAKFRGAGQGARALVAELIAGLLALHAGLPVPELALIHLDAAFGRTERDPEIQDILKGSRGLNVGLRYLEGAFPYDSVAVPELVPPALAADVVWFDAFLTNIDRTPRNPNILVWGQAPWLIDHGAALYFHHDWPALDEARTRTPFTPIRQHVLLPFAGDLEAADARMAARLGPVIAEVVAQLPDALLMDAPEGRAPAFPTPEANRDAYAAYLTRRLQAPRPFVEEALRAQAALRDAAPTLQSYRR